MKLLESRLALIICIVINLSHPLYGEDLTASISTVPRQQEPGVEILSETVIARQEKRYLGWPTITRAKNGDLLVAFSGDRDWHVCPWGKIYVVRSTDEGKTWGEPVVVFDSPLDDRDAGIATLPDGTIIVTTNASLAFEDPKIERYKIYKSHSATLSKAVREQWLGNWIIRSNDNGLTWSKPDRAPINTPHGATVLADGRLIYVRPSISDSKDQGRTWKEIATVKRDPKTWRSRYAFLSEQHAVETQDGKILALSRYRSKDGEDNFLRQMESTDGGKTWTDPTPTKMLGYPAHLLKLKNGWLLATYSRRVKPMGERACLSKDNGKTWLTDQEIVLSNAVPQEAGDLGYPSSVQLPDGSICTVYYQVEKSEQGPYPSIMGTHWRINQE